MKTTIETREVAVLLTSSQFLGPNPHRKAIIIGAPPTNRITVTFDATAVLDEGISVPPNTRALILTREQLGDAIGQPMTAISAVAAQGIGVTEVSLAP